ncbi:hypothetical protein MLD38_017448 [Melastoma candidum]|uniref:Uncharacterized protein n=1 Tax=Melastoma candidum TaxID=119954 RepID=A0ACB9QQP2_9MYRT|nr:hypothetical protein MLD38_017448 [Melastoma candidum]
MEDHEDNKVSMDVVPPTEHLCFVRCNFCNSVLAVGIPCKRMLETVTVKCCHCSNLTFLATRPPLQGGQCLDYPLFSHQVNNVRSSPTFQVKQGFCGEFRKGGQPSSSSSSSIDVPPSPKEQFVMKRQPLPFLEFS